MLFRSKPSSRRRVANEITIHKSMNHSNIVQFERCFEDDNHVYLLLELCSNKTLREMLRRRGRLQELEAQYFINQLINGVKHIHSKKIIHRDLKLGNLFLGKSLELKIGDFGLAARVGYAGERKKTVCGTPNYIAPEVLNSKTFGHSYEADVWSIGVILYTILIGKPPFETANVKLTYNRIKENKKQEQKKIKYTKITKLEIL